MGARTGTARAVEVLCPRPWGTPPANAVQLCQNPPVSAFQTTQPVLAQPLPRGEAVPSRWLLSLCPQRPFPRAFLRIDSFASCGQLPSSLSVTPFPAVPSQRLAEPTFKGLCLLHPSSPGARGQVPVSLRTSLCRPRAGGVAPGTPPPSGWLRFFHHLFSWMPLRCVLWRLLSAVAVGQVPSESLEVGQAVTSSSRCVRSGPVMANL